MEAIDHHRADIESRTVRQGDTVEAASVAGRGARSAAPSTRINLSEIIKRARMLTKRDINSRSEIFAKNIEWRWIRPFSNFKKVLLSQRSLTIIGQGRTLRGVD